MDKNNEGWLDDVLARPAFQSLDPDQIGSLRTLMQEIDGKDPMEAMKIMISFQKSMPKGRELDRAEQSAMLEAIVSVMPDNEREKLAPVIGFLRKRIG